VCHSGEHGVYVIVVERRQ